MAYIRIYIPDFYYFKLHKINYEVRKISITYHAIFAEEVFIYSLQCHYNYFKFMYPYILVHSNPAFLLKILHGNMHI